MPENLRNKNRDGAQATVAIRDLPNFSARRKGLGLSAAAARKLDEAVGAAMPDQRRITARRTYTMTLRERDGELFFQLPKAISQAFALRAGDTVR